MKNLGFFLFLVLLATTSLEINAQTCKPSGGIRGRKPPPGECNRENNSDCCVQGKFYTTYTCSPPVTGDTKATLTINSFQKGGDGGGPSECDNQYHSDDTPGAVNWMVQGRGCWPFHRGISVFTEKESNRGQNWSIPVGKV
uniref:Uncharacterized protein n=1 Tax=Lactuca sativa TaxID=4236 RepID=A0A9R1VTA5_LACSA|nr:hypothetical protein LSAT_V11C400173260 [Lactuca sativa]